MDVWMVGQTDGRTEGWINDGWKSAGWMDEWVSGWMCGWVDRLMDGQMDRWNLVPVPHETSGFRGQMCSGTNSRWYRIKG